MGIFKVENMMSEGVDYAAALQKIETEVKKSQMKQEAAEKGQIDSISGTHAKTQ